jgi:hypothetical protein
MIGLIPDEPLLRSARPRQANGNSHWPKNVLNAMSRIAPQFMFKQMAKIAKPKRSDPAQLTNGRRYCAHRS